MAARRDRGEYDEAVSCFDEAISPDPGFTQAYCNRGIAHYEKGEYDLAVADFN